MTSGFGLQFSNNAKKAHAINYFSMGPMDWWYIHEHQLFNGVILHSGGDAKLQVTLVKSLTFLDASMVMNSSNFLLANFPHFQSDMFGDFPWMFCWFSPDIGWFSPENSGDFPQLFIGDLPISAWLAALRPEEVAAMTAVKKAQDAYDVPWHV